jgi:hypothetical protein
MFAECSNQDCCACFSGSATVGASHELNFLEFTRQPDHQASNTPIPDQKVAPCPKNHDWMVFVSGPERNISQRFFACYSQKSVGWPSDSKGRMAPHGFVKQHIPAKML